MLCLPRLSFLPVPPFLFVVAVARVCVQIKLPQFGNFGQMVQGQAKFGSKKLAVITGTSSGLGKMTARALLRTGEWHVVGAVRDLDKMELVAEMEDFNLNVSDYHKKKRRERRLCMGNTQAPRCPSRVQAIH